MSKRRRRKLSDNDNSFDFGGGLGVNLSNETKRGIGIIFLFVLAALLWLALFNLAGQLGHGLLWLVTVMFGNLKWLLAVFLTLWGALLLQEKFPVKAVNYIGAFLLFIGLSGVWHLKFPPGQMFMAAKEGLGSGYLGALLDYPMFQLMGFWGSWVVFFAILLVGVLLALETSIYGLMWPWRLTKFIFTKLILAARSTRTVPRVKNDFTDDNYEEETNNFAFSDDNKLKFGKKMLADSLPEAEEEVEETKEEPEEYISIPVFKDKQELNRFADKKFGKKIEIPLELLSSRSGKPTSGDIRTNQEIIKKTLANFSIPVEMGLVNIGPTVTQYTFRPSDGVRLSKIVNLGGDLALALAAHPVRIEAPIPGKSLVGIEIPNQIAAKVTMFDMVSGAEFKKRPNDLSIALGKDVSGQNCFAQLDKMPHLLIAGSTGSGKSVCVNSIIVSLLFQNSPDDLKFILIDPKRVELPAYNGIPYLLTPVITDVKKTINALKWAVTEMENRLELLSKYGKRNIASYNETAKSKLPYIIIVIDELADLMATSSADVEGSIVRLAQMSRAVGIHLILATQRPSVEVLTGLIKANVPARIAFSVSSSIDSRTILDASGAEKLVGRGDMLYLGPETSKPKRIQGVFLTDREINGVIDYIKSQGEADYLEGIVDKPTLGSFGSNGFDGGDEPLLEEAVNVIRESGKASTTLLQRRLKIGYSRAARIMDLLEDQGIVGPADGAKPREVFLNKLKGLGALEFAAKEHGLEGELEAYDQEMMAEEEPSFTAFKPKESEEENNVSDEEDNPLLAMKPELPETDFSELIGEESEAIEDEPEEEVEEMEEESPFIQDEIEEEKEEDKKSKIRSRIFSEDEWT